MTSGNAPKRPGRRELTRPAQSPSSSKADRLIELEATRQELREALEQQTATSDILKVIATSPTDVQPVLDAIAQSAARVCGANDAHVYRVDGDLLRQWAHYGPIPGLEPDESLPLSGGSLIGRSIVDRRAIHTRDAATDLDPDEYPISVQLQRRWGYRTSLAVPLLREGVAIGGIAIRRMEVRPFTPTQIELLRTFAAQAVIAIENVRLFNETKEALERQTALAEILRVISRSPTDVQPVLDAIVENALRFCAAEDAAVMLPDGDHLQLSAHRGAVPAASDLRYPNDGTSVSSRAFLEARTIAVQDLQTAIDLPLGAENARLGGYHAIVGAPLLHAGAAVGAIVLRRFDARPFSEREIGALETFAAQAVIAIENVRLFNETKEALERQTATSEVLRVISSSPTDVQPVLDAIVENALRFCAAANAIVMLPDGDDLRLAAHRGPLPLAANLRYPNDGTTMNSRAFLEARTIAVQDLQAEAEYPLGAEHARAYGYHAVVVAPLLRDGVALGTIGLRRSDALSFNEREIGALEAFADQAVIAIENVRLFNETKEALEQQTAIGEILRVISGSPTDIQPVLETIAKGAALFCGAEDAGVGLVRGDELVLIAHHGPIAWSFTSFPVTSASVTARVIAGGRTFHAPDMEALSDEEYGEGKAFAREHGYRGFLAAPLLKDGRAIGVVQLRRREPGLFTAQQIRLVETFADQAVIAIENVRLFNETNEALERQTAVAEVLSTTLASGGELRPVLDAVVQRATQLCGADVAYIYRVEGPEAYRMVAMHGAEPNTKELLPFFNTTVRGATIGRALIDRATVHIPDIEKDAEYDEEFGTQRTQLAVPLKRGGVPIGVLGLWRYQARPFTADQIRLVETFADQAAIAIENVRLFNEIQDKSKALAAASRHKSEFLANMSHELRTPLNAIIGFSDVLEQRLFGELNERQADYTRDIASSGRHLLDLVNEILDLSKVEAGRMELEPSEFALGETIRGALAFVRERAARHAIELTDDAPGDLGTVVADERKVRQVLLNLLSNAVKFTPDGGTIAVQAQRRAGEVQVSVRDTGIGIALEDQAKVFDEFQQVGRPSDRSREGTGLGLTLAKRFIELHGGRIWIESEVGTGTTFTFAIPVARSAAAPA